ncbi:MAG: phosphate ABC transporter substrate-binding protein PstS [Actinobacteria bacterium]|nr:phosphate ABC transporter substrate-binding protein PstS [Actinomycetota bacterium]
MRKTITALALAAVVAFALSAAASAHRSSTSLVGAGSSLVAPLVSVWTQPVDTAFGYQISYSAIGSGGGISSITSRTVDFGASDAPLTPDQMKACGNCVEIPWALTATTLSYNVPGIPNDLHLNGPTVAGIFLGTIKSWDDPAIKKLNPKLNLPHLAITPIYRSDPSGDTFVITDYLSKVSPAWSKQVGSGTTVGWPTGVGEKGNSGVAGQISTDPGAIGYISAAYTLSNHLPVAALQNASGAFATPGLRGITAAASTLPKNVSVNRGVSLVNPPKGNKLAYPMATFTYVIIPSRSSKATELRKFVYWAVTQGQSYGAKLIFAKLPNQVLVADEKALKLIQPGT